MFEIGDNLIPGWAFSDFRDVWDLKQNGPNGIYWRESKNEVTFLSMHMPVQHRKMMAAKLPNTLGSFANETGVVFEIQSQQADGLSLPLISCVTLVTGTPLFGPQLLYKLETLVSHPLKAESELSWVAIAMLRTKQASISHKGHITAQVARPHHQHEIL